MTPEQVKAKEYAEILLAFSRGEKVECCLSSGKWDTAEGMQFPTIQYRIVPKPIERWAWTDGKGGFVSTYSEKARAEEQARVAGGRHFLMREVLE